jgi:hypothetical protein
MNAPDGAVTLMAFKEPSEQERREKQIVELTINSRMVL